MTFEGRELLAPVFGRLGRNNTDKIVNCWWSADTLSQEADNAFKNCYTIPANNTVDYAEKLNDVRFFTIGPSNCTLLVSKPSDAVP